MSRLIQMQARFQQKQMQEKEEKLLKLYESQQQRAIEKVSRGSAGSNGSITTTIQAGKVRQMFDERRQKAGIDKSYPLEPLKTTRSNGIAKSIPDAKNGRSIIKTTMQKSYTQSRNGKPIVGKRQVVQSVYKNNYGDESYEESRYEDDNGNDSQYSSPERNLVSLMNGHNIDDNYLDDEEMPTLIYDEAEPVTNYSRNVGRKTSISQTLHAKQPETKTAIKTNGVKKPTTIAKKEMIKPTVKKSVVKSNVATASVRSPPSTASSIATKSSSKNLSVDSVDNMSVQQKTPSNTRPSAKQVAKGPASAVVRDDLIECRYCSRRFAEDRLAVHQEICAKTGKKKRKTYDATKHRVQGTEMEPFAKKGTRPTPKVKQSGSKSNWRQKHAEFISAIRAAKVAQAHVASGGKLSDLPPPPPSSNPDYIQCPHCGRKFNESAAERHIPKCATYEFNKPKAATRGTRSFPK